MAQFKEHCDDCVRELGEPFDYVHIWLDELFRVMGPKHRSARHHTGGVEEVRVRWGDSAARAAEVHIKRDWYGRVPTEREAQMWSFFGPDVEPVNGQTILTDEPKGE